MSKLKLFFLINLIHCFGYAFDNLETGSSIANSYEAKNIFVNPAAIAFERELNGDFPSGAFSYAIGNKESDSIAFGFVWSYLGFGYEKISELLDSYSRVSLGVGLPLNEKIFIGVRHSWLFPTYNGLSNSLDFGLQLKPSKYFSVGLLLNGLNKIGTHESLSFGTIIRPHSKLNFILEGFIKRPNFSTIGYLCSIGYSLFNGLEFSLGYHQNYKWLFSFKLDFDYGNFQTLIKPSTDKKTAILGLIGSANRRKSLFGTNRILRINIDSSTVEEPNEGNLFFHEKQSFFKIVNELNNAKNNPNIKSVIINLESFPLGLSNAREIYDLLLKLKSVGKKVEVYIGNSNLKEYLIASAADKIIMKPSCQLDFTGFRFEKLFFKGTLDKLGIEGEIYAKGKYKSYPEQFTRKESSPEVRKESLKSLEILEKHFVSLLIKSKRLDVLKWKNTLYQALLSSEEALKAGLVDEINFPPKEFIKELKTVSTSLEKSDSLFLPERIAVIYATGLLTNENSFFQNSINVSTPDEIRKKFEKALNDNRVKAIVFRVVSGGGEASASYEIASIVEEAKKLKPVVVSMGSVAASGGYAISLVGNEVFSDPFSLTGSIGVFVGKVNLKELFKKIDLNREILTHAPHGDLMSWDRPFSKEGRKIIIRELNEYYDFFVNFVSKKRKLSLIEVEKVAEGKVFLGEEAHKFKLIDKIGGLLEASVRAAEIAKISSNYELVPIRKENYFSFETMLFPFWSYPEIDFLKNKSPLLITDTVINP